MAKYSDAIQWIVEQGDIDEWISGDTAPIPALVMLTCHLFSKTTKQVHKDLWQESWEQDNVDRGNI